MFRFVQEDEELHDGRSACVRVRFAAAECVRSAVEVGLLRLGLLER